MIMDIKKLINNPLPRLLKSLLYLFHNSFECLHDVLSFSICLLFKRILYPYLLCTYTFLYVTLPVLDLYVSVLDLYVSSMRIPIFFLMHSYYTNRINHLI